MKTKIRIWNKHYSRTVLKNNILRVWLRCDEEDRFDWYLDARNKAQEIANESGLPLIVVVGVIAALSPKLTWRRNLIEARAMCLNRNCKQMGLFKRKALDIIYSTGTQSEIESILRGNKITAFFRNIMFPGNQESVTVDRHAIRIALGKDFTDDELIALGDNAYQFIQESYKYTAEKIGVSPLLLQSATWVRYRKELKTK